MHERDRGREACSLLDGCGRIQQEDVRRSLRQGETKLAGLPDGEKVVFAVTAHDADAPRQARVRGQEQHREPELPGRRIGRSRCPAAHGEPGQAPLTMRRAKTT
jgi:hypothetical protein